MIISTVFGALRRPHACSSSCSRLYAAFLLKSSAVQPEPCSLRSQPSRPIHNTRPLRGPDRPTAFTNMLASDVPPPVQVSSVGSAGIKLADGLVLTGPVVFLEGKVLLWDVPSVGRGSTSVWDEWTREHWEVFHVVVPKPEILIFGTGAQMELVPSRVKGYVKELGIQMDIMDTKNACSTYNLLAEEGRRVAAALLPIEPKKWARKEGW